MTQNAFIVTDLQYGDAGKGTLVDYLTRQYVAHTVVRFNGGAQAAHNVVAPDGRHHTFAQFGAGMFVRGVRTYLSRYMLLDPLAMLAEADHLDELGISDAFQRTAIDREALIITPYQQAANRLREIARGADRHGSCGMGIGETMADFLVHGDAMLKAGDLPHPAIVQRKMAAMREWKTDQLRHMLREWSDTEAAAVFADDELIAACADVYADFAANVALVGDAYQQQLIRQSGTLIFEGAQGVLLDEWYGFHPYTTWSTTTFKNADALLAGYDGRVVKLGVVRAYMTRHGAGPFVTEDTALTQAIPDWHNGLNDWQGRFRIGHFDAVALRYALQVAGHVDALAVTNFDRLASQAQWQICDRYHHAGDDDISALFQHEGRTIHAITVEPAPNLDHQARLTQALFNCTPHYTPIVNRATLPQDEAVRHYCDALTARCGVPVAITSHGVMATDKRPTDFDLSRLLS